MATGGSAWLLFFAGQGKWEGWCEPDANTARSMTYYLSDTVAAAVTATAAAAVTATAAAAAAAAAKAATATVTAAATATATDVEGGGVEFTYGQG